MNPMSTAPKDGTRILIRYVIMHYRYPDQREVERNLLTPNELGRMRRLGLSRRFQDWFPSGDKWEECYWVSRKEQTGSDPHWEPWCGSYTVSTTDHISEDKCLGWLPRPEETAVDDSSH